MAKQEMNVMIGGEAGQGLVTIGQVLTLALVRAGYQVAVSQDYMSRVRGGHNTFTIRVGTGPVPGPIDGVDLLVALNQETLDLHREELTPDARVVADMGLTCGQAPCLNVPFADLAKKRYLNTVALAVTAYLMGLDRELIDKTLGKYLGKKLTEEVARDNREALDGAYDWAKENVPEFTPLEPAADAGKRLTLNGNQAIGLGALAAGVKMLSFYPMTPSTSIALTIISQAEKMGVVVEQAEDEISAINMALGASYAGAPSMVTTSGGGYALMTEGVSLAGITETPVVVALSQRPGPATGLPTRTEQGDLEFVLHGGHGEFPRLIFAPGDVEQCFWLTVKAFQQAEKFQTPAFVLTDQFLADSFRAIQPFDLSQVQPVTAGARDLGQGADYRRYAVTDSGISPRAIPGLGPELVLSDSDEHDEAGHITESGQVRIAQNDKRLRKFSAILGEITPPEFQGPEAAKLLLVCWGSSKGAVAEAAARLAKQGRSVACCHFSQVWPLKPDQFLKRFQAADKVAFVEMNATGQFAKLVRRETGFSADRLVLRYDGRPLTPSFIMDKLAD